MASLSSASLAPANAAAAASVTTATSSSASTTTTTTTTTSSAGRPRAHHEVMGLDRTGRAKPAPLRFDIRAATPADFEFVKKAVYAVESVEGLEEPSEPESIEEYRRYFEESIKAGYSFIAVDPTTKKNAGCMVIVVSNKTPFGVDYPSWSNKIAWVSYVYTVDEYRRRGLANQFYEFLESYCRRAGIQEIMLDVYLSNQGSMRFHESTGFKPIVMIYTKQVAPAAKL